MSVLTILGALAKLSGSFVWRIITALWATIRANPWRALAVTLLLCCAWVCHLLAGTRNDLDLAKIQLATSIKGRADDRTRYENESQAAAVIWDAQIQVQKDGYLLAAEKADNDAQKMRQSFDALTADYARRMRLAAICPAAVGGLSGQAAGSAQTQGAQGADGPGADAVVVSRADLDILTHNTDRLKAAHDWAVENLQ